MTRKEIRRIIQSNLEENGFGFYSSDEINDSIQDCYNEICAKTQCLNTTVTVNFIPSNYYDFIALGVYDYLGTIAIFNNNTNVFLSDDLTLRDFDRVRLDWEVWEGQPLFWCPHSLNKIAIIPHLSSAAGNFDLYYYQQAPILVDDETEILIASDVQTAFEHYCTADLLETANEFVKAAGFRVQYDSSIKEYKRRCHNIAASELIQRV